LEIIKVYEIRQYNTKIIWKIIKSLTS